MIKYFGNPLQEVKSKSTGKVMFTFDTKGEFITDDDAIIRRASGFFDSMEINIDEKKPEGKKTKKTHVVPPIVITTKEDDKNA